MADHLDSVAGPVPAPERPSHSGGTAAPPRRSPSLAARPRRTIRLADTRGAVRLDPGTFLQRSGVSLFLKVLLAASLVILGLFLNLLIELHRAPGLPDGDGLAQAFARGDTLQAVRLAAQYRALGEVSLAHRDAAWTHFVMGIKELVVTVFFPLLTGILGYIFGTRHDAASSAGNGGDGRG
jgi:hypothetical protein